MEQILYISTAREEPTGRTLRDILAVSRANNRKDGLSGLLLVGGRRFLQVLEGPRDALERTYARIRYDERHFALVQLARRPIDKPSFPGWDMGFEQEGGLTLPEIVGQLVDRIEDPNLRAQLISFGEIHRRDPAPLILAD